MATFGAVPLLQQQRHQRRKIGGVTLYHPLSANPQRKKTRMACGENGRISAKAGGRRGGGILKGTVANGDKLRTRCRWTRGMLAAASAGRRRLSRRICCRRRATAATPSRAASSCTPGTSRTAQLASWHSARKTGFKPPTPLTRERRYSFPMKMTGMPFCSVHDRSATSCQQCYNGKNSTGRFSSTSVSPCTPDGMMSMRRRGRWT